MEGALYARLCGSVLVPSVADWNHRFNSGESGGALWARLSYLIAGAFQRTENACHCEPEDALRDHYVALGVTPDADHEVIKAAFRALAKKYHPDTVAHAVAAEGRFREINEAHAVLSNPEARTEYDRWLLAQRGTAAPFVFCLWPAVFLFTGLVMLTGTAAVPSGR